MRGRALDVEWLLARPRLVVAFFAIAIALPVAPLGKVSATDTRERMRSAQFAMRDRG